MDKRKLYLYLATASVFLVLFILSGKEESKESDVSSLLKPFRKAALWIYKRYLFFARKRRGRYFRAARASYTGKMSLLDPAAGVKEAEEFFVTKIQNLLAFIFLADMMALLLYCRSSTDMLLDGTKLERDTYGGSTRQVQVDAGREAGTYTVSVEARKYTKEQADVLEKKLAEALPTLILEDNPDSLHVRNNLNLMSRVKGYPFKISWLLSDYTYMDRDGTVHSDEIPEDESVEEKLEAQLSYDGEKWEETIYVRLLPMELTREEEFRRKVLKAVIESGEKTAYDEAYVLPSSEEGKTLVWSQIADDDSLTVFLLFTLAGVVIFFAGDRDLSRKVKKRSAELELDYPHLVSMIVLFLGAGMSVRNVFYKIGDDYRKEREEGGRKRYAYEEILYLCNRLDSGMSESAAIGYFGMRCGSRSYTRLCALLVQNLKKGNAQLLQSLRQEADDALEARKNRAVRLGEEAGTKLLFPMVMMLIVAMIMIVVPAYLGFSS